MLKHTVKSKVKLYKIKNIFLNEPYESCWAQVKTLPSQNVPNWSKRLQNLSKRPNGQKSCPYLCFIALLYLDLYVLGDDALIS